MNEKYFADKHGLHLIPRLGKWYKETTDRDANSWLFSIDFDAIGTLEFAKLNEVVSAAQGIGETEINIFGNPYGIRALISVIVQSAD